MGRVLRAFSPLAMLSGGGASQEPAYVPPPPAPIEPKATQVDAPPAPAAQAEAPKAAASRAKAKAGSALGQGRAGTILTSPQGLIDSASPGQKKTLLGQ